MKPSRIILLVVALVAGLLAAYLAMGEGEPATVIVSEVVQEARTQILVAAAPIGVGERLTPATVSWQDWPEGAIRPEYVSIAVSPNALEEITGAVARFEFFAGEPIRSEKLVRADQGYLSAVLSEGMRGVSINVTAASGAGGFIVPNDRVDVVVTRQSNGSEVSETILRNIKVLAIGNRLGEVGPTSGSPDAANPQSQVFTDATIATLELDPLQAEVVINAAAVGELSLALRSVADFSETVDETHSNRANQPIRVIRFGEEASVMTGAKPEQPAAPDPTPAGPPINMAPTFSSTPPSGASSLAPPPSGAAPMIPPPVTQLQ